MRTQPGMTVLAPADFQQARTALTETTTVPGPIYFRLGKNETETVPGLDGRLRLDGVEQLGAGRDVAIVTTGSITREAAAAVELLEGQGWRSRLVVAACLSPAPTEALVTALRNVPLVVTVEAHYLTGGLGSLVSEVVAESGLGCRVVRCGVAGLPDSVGSEAFLNDGARPVGEPDRTSRRRGSRPARHARERRSPPDEEAERRHRLLPGRAGDPGDVRAPDRDVPLDRGRLRDHLRQRRQPRQRARGARRARRVGSARGRRQPHAELRISERVHERPPHRHRRRGDPPRRRSAGSARADRRVPREVARGLGRRLRRPRAPRHDAARCGSPTRRSIACSGPRPTSRFPSTPATSRCSTGA